MADPLLPVDALRLRHVRGEALRGHDFRDQTDQTDQLRWWHNRALHQAFGIARGLEVTIEDGVATVAPGLAYDRHGREVVLDAPRRIRVPDDAGTARLVLARRGGGVTVCWLPVGARTSGVRLDVPGAAASRVRPVARPRIGRGATVPGSTAWERWSESSGEQTLHLGIQVDVDTTAANFTATPCYFVQITGPTWDVRDPLTLLVPFEHIARQRSNGFTVRLLMPWIFLSEAAAVPGPVAPARASARSEGAADELAGIPELAVTWIGIQHSTGGQP
jgi:hypothetical protein